MRRATKLRRIRGLWHHDPREGGSGYSALELQPFDISRDILSDILEVDLPSDTEEGCVVAVRATARACENEWAAHAAVALAGIWAAQGAKVLLVDLYLGEPHLHRVFGARNIEGIVDALEYGASLRRSLAPPTAAPTGSPRAERPSPTRASCSSSRAGAVCWKPWSTEASRSSSISQPSGPFIRAAPPRSYWQSRANPWPRWARWASGMRSLCWAPLQPVLPSARTTSAGRSTMLRCGMASRMRLQPSSPRPGHGRETHLGGPGSRRFRIPRSRRGLSVLAFTVLVLLRC